MERITVNLTPKASRALEDLGTMTGYNKTDIVSRALQVYAYIELIQANGGGFMVKDSSESNPVGLRFV